MKSTTALLLAAILGGALLRCWQASESLWVDELHTSWAVSGSLGEVAERAAIGNQSPLYFWLAWFFARLPLPPEMALRLPSLLAGCALPLFVAWLVRQFERRDGDQIAASGVMAAWLVAIDPLAIFYSQEARPYAIVLLVAVIHIGSLMKVLNNHQPRDRIAWIITGGLLVHLHYLAGLILLAEVVALLALSVGWRQIQADERGSAEPSLSKFVSARLSDGVVLALFIVPAAPGIIEVAERRENWNQFVTDAATSELLRMAAWALFPLSLWIARRRIASNVSLRSLLVLSSWLIVPLLTAWCLTYWHIAPIFHRRYLAIAWPASMVAAGLLLQAAHSLRARSLLIIGIFLWALLTNGLLENWLTSGRPLHRRNENWAAAVSRLNERLASEPLPVFVRSGWIEARELPPQTEPLFDDYCLAPVRGIYRVRAADQQLHPLSTDQPANLRPAARKAFVIEGGGWFLMRTSRRETPSEMLAELNRTLGSDFEVAPSAAEWFGNLYLQRVQVQRRP